MIGECALLVWGLSKHFMNEFEYQENHPAVGIQCDDTPIGPALTGYYQNSEGDPTWYGGVRSKLFNQHWAYLDFGAVVGYQHYPVAPFIRLGMDFKYIEIFAFPGYEKGSLKDAVIPVVGVQFKIPLPF